MPWVRIEQWVFIKCGPALKFEKFVEKITYHIFHNIVCVDIFHNVFLQVGLIRIVTKLKADLVDVSSCTELKEGGQSQGVAHDALDAISASEKGSKLKEMYKYPIT